MKQDVFQGFLVSKWNVVFAYYVVKRMLPHDCHPLLEKKTIVTKATKRVQTPVRNYLNCVQNCDDQDLLDFKSAFQYMKHFIYHIHSSRAH